MNLILLRYVGIALFAAIFGIGGGYLAVNNKSEQSASQSGTVSAIPAQPFPGQGIPTLPAIPAQPIQERPDIKAPTISDFWGGGIMWGNTVTPKLNMVVNGGEGVIEGTNFHPRNNSIYWDGVLIAKDVVPLGKTGKPSNNGLIMHTLTNMTLGSLHDLYVKTPYGTSNTIRVRVVENARTDFWLWGVRPEKAPIGTKVEVALSDVLTVDQPLSSEMYAMFIIPASAVKSGEAGGAFVFVPIEKNQSYPSYSFTPKEGVYCPSVMWPAEYCTLAPPDTKVTIPVGGPYTPDIFLHLEFKYLGNVTARAIGGVNIFTGWYPTFTVTQ